MGDDRSRDADRFEFTPVEMMWSPDSLIEFDLFLGVLAGLLAVSWFLGRRLSDLVSPERSASRSSRADSTQSGFSATPDSSSGDSSVDSEQDETETEVEAAERILDLLEEADGQLPQSRIVSETGWSKTKVSRTLSEMVADGEVKKIRLGRENLIFLPEHVPAVAEERTR